MKRYFALLLLLSASQPSMAQFLDLPKAVVQFDGVSKASDYTQINNTIEVEPDATGFNVRDKDWVCLEFTTGQLDGQVRYVEVLSSTPTKFTTTFPSTGAAVGRVWVRTVVKVHHNIASVCPSYNLAGGVVAGEFHISFADDFADNRYAAVGGDRYWAMQLQQAAYMQVRFYNNGGSAVAPPYAAFVVYGLQPGETP